jgi:YD repeat-containing protein
VTRLDLDGDGDFTGSGEHDDTRTHNVVNELLARDTDSDTNDDVTLGYDAVGNLVDDGEQYTYVYDAFGRLRRMRTQGDDDYAEFTYNGLNFKTSQVFDTDSDGDLGDETVERQVYDASWRIVAVYRGDAADPNEQYVWHNAGMGGFGGRSYIDDVILRDRDADLDENAVLEERLYYCQNWRADVSVVLTDDGKMVEWVKHSAYGVPFSLPAGDADSDGDWDATDYGIITGGGAYDVRKDADLNGVVAGPDVTHANSITGGYQTLGRGVLSSAAVNNRRGYAGYEYDPTFEGAGGGGGYPTSPSPPSKSPCGGPGGGGGGPAGPVGGGDPGSVSLDDWLDRRLGNGPRTIGFMPNDHALDLLNDLAHAGCMVACLGQSGASAAVQFFNPLPVGPRYTPGSGWGFDRQLENLAGPMGSVAGCFADQLQSGIDNLGPNAGHPGGNADWDKMYRSWDRRSRGWGIIGRGLKKFKWIGLGMNVVNAPGECARACADAAANGWGCGCSVASQ